MAGGVRLCQRNFVNAFALLVSDLRCSRDNRTSYLLSSTAPGSEIVHRILLGRLLGSFIHLLRVRNGKLSPSQATHEIDYRRPIFGPVETRADLVHQNAAVIRRAMGKVPIDHADRFEAAQALS